MSESPSKEEILALWLQGDLSDEDVIATLGREEWEEQKKILKTTSTFSPPFSRTKEEAWQLLSSKISESEEAIIVPMNPSRRRLLISSAVAVAIVLLIGVYFMIPSPTVFETKTGEQLTFFLPDSSSVIMNAGSSISFNEKEWAENRELDLTGEAFFNVKKGSKFTVNSANSQVEVLGTRFNVLARTEKNQVTCYHGKVKVSDRSGTQSEVLTEGMGLNINDQGSFIRFSHVYKEMPEWSTGTFRYSQEPFENVIAELERQFGVSVEYPEMDKTYTGLFHRDDDLKDALELVCEPMGLTIDTVIDSKIVLKLTRIP